MGLFDSGLFGIFQNRAKKKLKKQVDGYNQQLVDLGKSKQDWLNNFKFTPMVNNEQIGSAGFEQGNFKFNVNKNPLLTRARTQADEGYADAMGQLRGLDLSGAIRNSEQAYKDEAMTNFNKRYNPMVDQLRENIGQRFGGFNNTAFTDGFSKLINNTYSPAVQSINNQAVLNKGQFAQAQLSPIQQLLDTYGIAADRDTQDTLQKLQTLSQGYNQGATNIQNSDRDLTNAIRGQLGTAQQNWQTGGELSGYTPTQLRSDYNSSLSAIIRALTGGSP